MKALGEFHKSNHKKNGLKARCKACAKAYNDTPERKARAAAFARTPERKAYWRFRYTGFTHDDYESRLVAQEGRCAICGEHHGTKLHADHHHESGTKRLLLCSNCNTAIGLLKDSPANLNSALAYLLATGQAHPTETLEAAITRHEEIIRQY